MQSPCTVLEQHQVDLDTFADRDYDDNDHDHGDSDDNGEFPSFDPVFLALAKRLYPTLARRAARKYVQTYTDPLGNRTLCSAGLVSPRVVVEAAKLWRRAPPRFVTGNNVLWRRWVAPGHAEVFCVPSNIPAALQRYYRRQAMQR